MKDLININIATLPEREQFLKLCINSLINQCDNIYVMLNNYTKVPDWLKKNTKIGYIIRRNQKGCSEKFFLSPIQSGWLFYCDDDLIYPPDYCNYMIKKAIQYSGIVSLHGAILNDKVSNYYKDRRVFHCLHDHLKDSFVDIAGSGVCCMHSSIIKPDYQSVIHPNMSDIYLSIQAKKQNINRVCVSHKGGWLKYSPVPQEQTIWFQHRKNCEKQTELINTQYK